MLTAGAAAVLIAAAYLHLWVFAAALLSGQALLAAGGGLALVGRFVTEYGDSSAQTSRSVGVLLPLALGGPAAFLLGHFLMG